MIDPKKIANNILDFLIDPTKIPVQQRLYFRPEERLQNGVLDKSRADAYKAYGEQRYNSDFYPSKNRLLNLERQAFLMDRKSLIASFDILSQNFKEKNDPFSVQLRTMALAVSKMKDEELDARLAEGAPDLEGTLVEAKSYPTFKCPECGTKVLQQTGYCVKCKKKVKKAEEDKDAFLVSGPVKPETQRVPLMERGLGGGKIKSVYDENKEEIEGNPVLKNFFKKLLRREEEEVAVTAETVASTDEDNWTDDVVAVVANYLVQDVIGADAPAVDEEPEPVKEEAVPKVEPPKKEEKKVEVVVPKKEETTPPAEEKKAVKKKEEKKEEKKEVEAKKEESVKEEEKKEEKKACDEPPCKKEEKAKPKAEEKKAEAVVVNTDVLATFGGIEIPRGIVTIDDPEIGPLTADEQARLAQLF